MQSLRVPDALTSCRKLDGHPPGLDSCARTPVEGLTRDIYVAEHNLGSDARRSRGLRIERYREMDARRPDARSSNAPPLTVFVRYASMCRLGFVTPFDSG